MDLLLDRKPEAPIRRSDTPAGQKIGVERAGLDGLAKGQIRDLPAEVSPTGAKILRLRILQIAIRLEVAVRIGPRPLHSQRPERRIGVRQPERRIRIVEDDRIASTRPFEVSAETELHSGFPGAEDVQGGADPW
jgi:hypothetical protein